MTRRSLVQVAKDAKHAQLVARRRLPEVPGILRDRSYRVSDRIRPYAYGNSDFPDSFVSHTPKASDGPAPAVPLRIFVTWTGDNELTPNRAAALDEIRAIAAGTEVALVTPESLPTWTLPAHPLHPAYVNLSLVHRSDYLRAYLLHHHGGAYLDIKRGYGDVRAGMDALQAAPGKWVAGYRELGADSVSTAPGTIHRALRRHHGLLLGNGAFAARPTTVFTTEWLSEVDRRMDRWAPGLERVPGNVLGNNDGYPVPWTALLGDVFHPLCLKYADRLLHDVRFRPSFEDYR
ncbi:hypothetical protein EUA06_05290 [Nocardioides glacieisoli]|uniref:Capsular biosynthesis protein n=1 Tax=Nocardioides glacieisoli TaxID=1168730 RepID=A0A4V1RKI2_9ACTN|nr:hypothetical protein [Nocardioides glacieisoli]RYB92372.1 hypothetical protein EUA06_05290 [Nocardioides glacieisoli]